MTNDEATRPHEDFQAWLVDLDGTLYHPSPVRAGMACELALTGWRAIPVLRVFRGQLETLRNDLEQEVDDPYQLQIEQTAEKCDLSSDKVREMVTKWMQQRPGKWLRLFRHTALLKKIERFREQGGRTALVSDYPARVKLQALHASEQFDRVVASGEPGGPRRLKPWPDGYRLAADQLGVHPAECLVLGDRSDADGEASRRAGMEFFQVRTL